MNSPDEFVTKFPVMASEAHVRQFSRMRGDEKNGASYQRQHQHIGHAASAHNRAGPKTHVREGEPDRSAAELKALTKRHGDAPDGSVGDRGEHREMNDAHVKNGIAMIAAAVAAASIQDSIGLGIGLSK